VEVGGRLEGPLRFLFETYLITTVFWFILFRKKEGLGAYPTGVYVLVVEL
jgi:hypothetical protein